MKRSLSPPTTHIYIRCKGDQISGLDSSGKSSAQILSGENDVLAWSNQKFENLKILDHSKKNEKKVRNAGVKKVCTSEGTHLFLKKT